MFWTVVGNRSAPPTTIIMLTSRYSVVVGLTVVVAVTLLGLVSVASAEGRLVERFIWNELQFDWPSAEAKEAALQSEAVSSTILQILRSLFEFSAILFY